MFQHQENMHPTPMNQFPVPMPHSQHRGNDELMSIVTQFSGQQNQNLMSRNQVSLTLQQPNQKDKKEGREDHLMDSRYDLSRYPIRRDFSTWFDQQTIPFPQQFNDFQSQMTITRQHNPINNVDFTHRFRNLPVPFGQQISHVTEQPNLHMSITPQFSCFQQPQHPGIRVDLPTQFDEQKKTPVALARLQQQENKNLPVITRMPHQQNHSVISTTELFQNQPNKNLITMTQFPQQHSDTNPIESKSDDALPKSTKRSKPIAWTKEEHMLFLLGVDNRGKGDWKGISRFYVKSKTPTQVASHAQKYYIRQETTAANKRRKRKSIHDITLESEGLVFPNNEQVVTPSSSSSSQL